MARIRTIKPEFLNDEKLSYLSRDARLTFIGMWIHSDDYGVIKGHLTWLKSQIFPYDEIKPTIFAEWVNELCTIKVIIPFSKNHESYYFIKHFTSHQKVDRPSQWRNPEPPDNITDILDEGSTSTQTPLVAVSSKGKEGKGKEGKGNKIFTIPTIDEISSFCLERKNSVDADKFYNYYSSNGWMVGKNKMKDWKAAIRTWEANGKASGHRSGESKAHGTAGLAKSDDREYPVEQF